MNENGTLAEHLYRHIEDAGVDTLFGVPGDFSLGMLDVLEAGSVLNWVGCATEIGAGYCADGYARANGLGVFLTTYGVGELSASVAVAGSTAEDVGVLHIVAAPPTGAFTAGSALHHSFADGDLHRFARAASEIHSAVFHATSAAPLETLREAIAHWRSSRRTTYFLLPLDVAAFEMDRPYEPLVLETARTTEQAQEIIAAFHAEHPEAVAVLGNVAQRRGLRPLVRELSRRGVRMAVLPNAKGLVDESDPMYLGVYSGKLSAPHVAARVESASGRVLLGCTLADTTTGGLSHIFPDESTLRLDAEDVRAGNDHARSPLAATASSWAELYPVRSATSLTTTGAPCPGLPEEEGRFDQNTLWNSIAETLPSGIRLFAETGSPHYGALDVRFPDDTSFECAAIWSAIGFALPAALGSSLADRDRRVVAVVGDGAIQMTANEFGLIDRYDAHPIVVLVDNGGYTVERIIRGERASYNDIAPWRWAEVPAALGAGPSTQVTTCSTAHEFRSAFTEALTRKDEAHVLVVSFGRYDATPSLHRMGRLLRAKAHLPSLEDALAEGDAR